MPCVTCGLKFFDTNELEAHTQETHPFLCVICFIELENKEGLGRHIEDSHTYTYTCDVFGFIAISEDVMENHILGKHARPDLDGEFKCDDCEFNSKDKEEYGKHFKEVHGSKANKEATRVDNSSQLVEEMRILKHNFERLETMYQDSLEEVNNVKSEYEARLIKANANYGVVKAENEVFLCFGIFIGPRN